MVVSTNLSAELLNKQSRGSAWQSSREVLIWIRFYVPASFFSSSPLELTAKGKKSQILTPKISIHVSSAFCP